ncbi:ead/Ea22-like family protein [Klebsiella michiganensis]|uniref:ead/Ea22-like family protein n=1 Tax=Klebsiella michiganensis TaxID=1134687 RepID=UPI0025417B84|nr:ead/Ea22-like family protein [Klebsiella michiganensis]MDK3052093.1 ead/Ea22-like family protein [Klebsiella michiganensis]
MTDITELAPAMKAAAKKATSGPWALARDRKTVVSNQSHPIANLSDAMHRMLADGTTGQDAEFISLANPANILALVEALEKAQKLPEPYAYLRENDGQIQISIGAERPSDRSGGYATPWFAIYTAAGIKREAE